MNSFDLHSFPRHSRLRAHDKVRSMKMKCLPRTNSCAAAILVLVLSGCVPGPSSVSSDRRLSTANFVVTLMGEDRDQAGIGEFFYRVTKKDAAQDPHFVPSGFLWLSLPLKEHVRLIESSDGRHLLIEEDIPNDCWMHKNYIIVSNGSRSLQHGYLDVPEAPHEGIPGPGGVPKAPDDPSTILSLDGGVLTFRYANGTVERRKLDRIRKMSRPHPPG